MNFSRAVAHASFIGLMWLMVVTAILFAALSLVQYLQAPTNGAPLTFALCAVGCVLFAMLLRFMARRILVQE